MVKKLRGLAPLLVIVIGLLVLFYPTISNFLVMKNASRVVSNYDAAVLAAGHCGFGLGATPTAIANMQAITQRFGPSHMAFLVVPMVGAFFIDIINAMVIKLAVSRTAPSMTSPRTPR